MGSTPTKIGSPRNIVLDLDETLIHSPIRINDVPRQCYSLKSHHVFLDGDLYVIFERPFLREFLRGLSGRRIAIWTAAHQEYAEFIVKNILKPHLARNQRFEFVWHREHCDVSEAKFNGVVKHLDFARNIFNPSDTLIIDDNNDIKVKGNNVYVIKPFQGCNKDDTELLKVLKTLS